MFCTNGKASVSTEDESVISFVFEIILGCVDENVGSLCIIVMFLSRSIRLVDEVVRSKLEVVEFEIFILSFPKLGCRYGRRSAPLYDQQVPKIKVQLNFP